MINLFLEKLSIAFGNSSFIPDFNVGRMMSRVAKNLKLEKTEFIFAPILETCHWKLLVFIVKSYFYSISKFQDY